jgi:hypothetical protein
MIVKYTTKEKELLAKLMICLGHGVETVVW